MANQSLKPFLHRLDCGMNLLKKQDTYRGFVYNVLTRCQSQQSKSDKADSDGSGKRKDTSRLPARSEEKEHLNYDMGLSKYSSDEDDANDNRWKLELAWLTKTLEPALQLYRWALPTGNADGHKSTTNSRSLSEIVASIQRSKVGLQDWSLSDLTVGLYLIYLRQASANEVEDFKGVQITSDAIAQDLIYHIELAKGAYKDNAAGLARNSMLQERNVVKFIKNSSVMRPGYYIGVDIRNRLVILGIRGTHTVYDLITDIVSSSDQEVTFEGYSTHFGTAEAARWFLNHEIGTLRECLEKNEGFRLRLLGHSLGGATASLLAIMLRKKSQKELGFSPDIVSAVGFATPPCVSKELAESCSSYVSTVVMQDDIIPRLSTTSLTRLRNEILQTDWISVLQKEDWRSIIDLVTNARQVVSTVQDVARKVADYANFRRKTNASNASIGKESESSSSSSSVDRVKTSNSKPEADSNAILKRNVVKIADELFVPGTLYYLKREVESNGDNKSLIKGSSRNREYFTLWKRNSGEHFQKIVLSSNLISDHKCDNHYYALRDVLKGLPNTSNVDIYR